MIDSRFSYWYGLYVLYHFYVWYGGFLSDLTIKGLWLCWFYRICDLRLVFHRCCLSQLFCEN